MLTAHKPDRWFHLHTGVKIIDASLLTQRD